jgi:hypothetical protein
MRHRFPQYVAFHVFTAGGILGFYAVQCNLFALTFLGSVLPPSAVILGHHDMLAKEAAEKSKKKHNPAKLVQIQDPMHNLNMKTGMCSTHSGRVFISQSNQWPKAMLW